MSVASGYHRQAVTLVDQLWSLVVGAVVQLDGVTGTRPRGHGVVAPYVRAAQRAARAAVGRHVGYAPQQQPKAAVPA
jgi:hypothetical protein